MFEPTTLLYALVGAAGLLGADAYYNSSTIHIETSVAPIYECLSREFLNRMNHL